MPRSLTVHAPDGRSATLNIPDGVDDAIVQEKLLAVKEMLGGPPPDQQAQGSQEQAFVGEQIDPNAPTVGGVARKGLDIAARNAPGILGGVAGGMIAGPPGAVLGGAIGQTAGILATEPNQPVGQTVIEAGTAGLGGAMAKPANIAEAMAQGMGISVLSNTANDVLDGKPIPPIGETAIAALTGAAVGGLAHKALDFTNEYQEILGDKEAATAMQRIKQGHDVPGMIQESRDIREMMSSLQSKVSKKTRTRMSSVMTDLEDLEHLIAKPVPEDPTGSGKITRLLGLMDVKKSQLERVQRQTGWSTFDDYLNVRFANEKYQDSLHQAAKDIEKQFKGTSRAERLQTMQDLLAGGGGQVRKMYDRHLQEFGMSADEFFTDVVPAVARGEHAPDMSRRLRGLAEYVNNGEFSVEEPDALLGLSRLAKISLFRKHVGDVWAENSVKYGAGDVPAEVKEPMQRYLNNVRGNTDWLGQRLTEALNEGLAILDPTAERFLGKKLRTTSQEFVSHILGASYSGLLGFRVGPVIRNAMQPLQVAGSLMGGRWLAKGYQLYGTSEGRALAASAGMRGAALTMAEVEDLARSTTGRALSKVSRVGLAPYSSVENVNRGSVYLGTRAKIEWAARKAKGDVGRFLDLSDIDRYSPGEINNVLSHYNTGDVDAAADLGAKFMVDKTQFLYGASEKPDALSGTAGKALMGLSNWPASYATFVRENFVPGASFGPTRKRVRDFSRFLVANAAIAGAFVGIGHSLGDRDSVQDQLGWTFMGPLFYTGGPVLEALQHGVKAARDVYAGKLQFDTNEFRAKGSEDIAAFDKSVKGFIPGHGGYEDISKALKEPTGTEAIGRFLGFKRGKK